MSERLIGEARAYSEFLSLSGLAAAGRSKQRPYSTPARARIRQSALR
jgi:hypothetical protein